MKYQDAHREIIHQNLQLQAQIKQIKNLSQETVQQNMDLTKRVKILENDNELLLSELALIKVLQGEV